MSGTSSLIQSFQQGYDWVDGVERKKSEDRFRGDAQNRQRQEWSTEDELTAKRKELYDKHFGEQAELQAVPEEMNRMRLLAQEQGMAQPSPAPLAPPVPTGAMGQAAPRLPLPARAGMIPAVYTEAVRQTESRGRANAIGPNIPGQGSAKGDMQVMDATFSSPGFGVRPAADDSMQERSRVGKDYYAALGDKYKDPALAAIAYNWGPGNADKWLAAGGDFSKLPKETQAYVGSVMTRGAVAQRGSGARMAADQGITAQAAPQPAPVEGVETPIQTRQSKVDPTVDVGNTLRYVLENARLDVQYGKKDGAGLAQLTKAAEALKKEGMSEATRLMDRGMYQEAQDLFNSSGDHRGVSIVSAKDGQYTAPDGRVWPTKIVTMQQPDGSKRVINTKQDAFLMMDIAKQAELANDSDRNRLAQQNYRDTLQERQVARADAREAAAISREDRLAEYAARREEQKGKRQYDAKRGVLIDPTTGQAEPIVGPDGQAIKSEENEKPLNDGQSKAYGFGSRMRNADEIINTLYAKGKQASTPGSRAPIIGDAVNALSGETNQKLNQAKTDFMTAILRRESGASIASTEFATADRQYFPQIGDSKAVIEQKARNRQTAIDGVLVEVPEKQRNALKAANPVKAAETVKNPFAGHPPEISDLLKKYGG